jgi:hypothetical protein
MKHIKVEGHPELNRDLSSGAIINTNKSDYDNYMKVARMKNLEKNKIDTIEKDLFTLKDEINEIKSLLLKLYKDKI